VGGGAVAPNKIEAEIFNTIILQITPIIFGPLIANNLVYFQ